MKEYKRAPEDFEGVKCNWLKCAGGMGLAGHGMCSFRGDWSNPDCPYFITVEAYDRQCHLDYIATTTWWKRVLRPVQSKLRHWFIMLKIQFNQHYWR